MRVPVTTFLIVGDYGSNAGHLVMEAANQFAAFSLKGMCHLVTLQETAELVAEELKNRYDLAGYESVGALRIVRGLGSTQLIEAIANTEAPATKCKIRVHVAWWRDLTIPTLRGLDDFLYRKSGSWEVVANVSGLLRRAWDCEPEEAQFLDFLRSCRALNRTLYWDPTDSHDASRRLGVKAVSLPEYHPARPEGSMTGSAKGRHRGDFLIVSFFGALQGRRGFGNFVLLAVLNPDCRFQARGYGYSGRALVAIPRSHRRFPLAWPFRRVTALCLSALVHALVRLLPNLHVDKSPFPDQVSLNEAIAESDAVFACGRYSPYSSGIALQSLACRTPVIWMAGESAASDILFKAYPAGLLRWPRLVGLRRLKPMLQRLPRPQGEVYGWTMYARMLTEDLADPG